ncbi:MAG: hypothetical protein ACI4QX_02250 [Lachnospiraceae bacterium]
MGTGWKNVGKRAGWAVLSYLVISMIAVVFHVIRLSLRGDGYNEETSWWEVLEFIIFPGLFLLAGYIGTMRCEFEKIKAYRALLFAAVFSAALLGLWYVLQEVYVLCNLPAAEGGCALDLSLRRMNITYGYEYTVLAKTDMYRYVILPLVHFFVRILYWLCYLWGNRICVSRREKNRK